MVTLISATAKTLDFPARARDMYQSKRFQKTVMWAEHRGLWFIVSTRYGLLLPDTIVEPRERGSTDLRNAPQKEIDAWLDLVTRQLKEQVPYAQQDVIICFMNYQFVHGLRKRMPKRRIEAPLERVRLNTDAIRWLEENRFKPYFLGRSLQEDLPKG